MHLWAKFGLQATNCKQLDLQMLLIEKVRPVNKKGFFQVQPLDKFGSSLSAFSPRWRMAADRQSLQVHCSCLGLA